MGIFDSKEERLRKAYDRALASGPKAMIAYMRQWLHYNSVLKFKTEVPLEDIIYGFTVPVAEFTRSNFPEIMKVPPGLFLRFVFAGVEASGTHSSEEIQRAKISFARKYDADFLID